MSKRVHFITVDLRNNEWDLVVHLESTYILKFFLIYSLLDEHVFFYKFFMITALTFYANSKCLHKVESRFDVIDTYFWIEFHIVDHMLYWQLLLLLYCYAYIQQWIYESHYWDYTTSYKDRNVYVFFNWKKSVVSKLFSSIPWESFGLLYLKFIA